MYGTFLFLQVYNLSITGMNKKTILWILCSTLVYFSGMAQTKYVINRGTASFFSSAPLEDISASTDHPQAALDTETGEILVKIPMNTFSFRKKLMQEHFNEQYLETEKYPEAVFQGHLSVIPEENGSVVNSMAKGMITIHGVQKRIKTPVTLTRVGDIIHGETKFDIRITDYNIKVPRIVVKNIAEVVQVSVNMEFKPYLDTIKK